MSAVAPSDKARRPVLTAEQKERVLQRRESLANDISEARDKSALTVQTISAKHRRYVTCITFK